MDSECTGSDAKSLYLLRLLRDKNNDSVLEHAPIFACQFARGRQPIF
jgi:hypothetical protein